MSGMYIVFNFKQNTAGTQKYDILYQLSQRLNSLTKREKFKVYAIAKDASSSLFLYIGETNRKEIIILLH